MRTILYKQVGEFIPVQSLSYDRRGINLLTYSHAFAEPIESQSSVDLGVATLRKRKEGEIAYFMAFGRVECKQEEATTFFSGFSSDELEKLELPKNLWFNEKGYLGPLNAPQANQLHELAGYQTMRQAASLILMSGFIKPEDAADFVGSVNDLVEGFNRLKAELSKHSLFDFEMVREMIKLVPNANYQRVMKFRK